LRPAEPARSPKFIVFWLAPGVGHTQNGSMLKTPLTALVLLASTTASALAHPHLFVDARATITFDEAGNLSLIRNEWTFDEAFSVWQIQGLDANSDGTMTSTELQGLADENLAALAAFGFYTSVGREGQTLELEPIGDARFEFSDRRSTLTFSVAPKVPYRMEGKLEIGIADPAYYVGITFADTSAVKVENLPAGCSTELLKGRPMSDDAAADLLALGPDVLQLPAELAAKLRGSQQEIVVNCGGGNP
jgi:nickel/cobalt exporter